MFKAIKTLSWMRLFGKEAPSLGKFHHSKSLQKNYIDDVSRTLSMIVQSNQILNNRTFQVIWNPFQKKIDNPNPSSFSKI